MARDVVTAAGGHLAAGVPPVVEMRGITKVFPGIVANADVDLDIRSGEVHALLGENGAGKSTLMNILTGIYQADSGEIAVEGRRLELRRPADAIAAGIGMVHQHFKLVQAFTVAENLQLGVGDAPAFLSPATLRARAQALEEQYGLKVTPDAPVYRLSAGEQQRVEILKALARGARILILDEPTAVLTQSEATLLFNVVRRLTSRGFSVVLISHKLDEVLQISDRITVLRAGRKVATVARAEADQAMLAKLMVGESIVTNRRAVEQENRTPVIQARNLVTRHDDGTSGLEDVSLTLLSGEILGIAGVAGNGQKELSEVLTGIQRVISGSITVDSRELSNRSAKSLAASGIGHIPEDRLRSGIAGPLSIIRNAILREYDAAPLSSGPWLRPDAARSFTAELLRAARVTAPSLNSPIRNLSGGNQQRFIVQRETRIAARALIAAYPTRGLDIAAAELVRSALVDLRNRGVAVLMISEDLDELLEVSDRIIVMYRGRILGERTPPWSREDFGLLMGGQSDALH